MNIKKELWKRKEGLVIGGILGAVIFYIGGKVQPTEMQSVITMAAANPTIASSAGLTPEWRILLTFIVVGMIIGMWVDNK